MKQEAPHQETVVISRKEYDEFLSLRNEFLTLSKELLSLKSDNQYYQFQLSELRRMLFGSKKERFVPSRGDGIQLELFALAPVEKPVEEIKETITCERTKEKSKPVRSSLPEHLKRVEEVIEPCSIPQGAVKIGEVVTEILEYKPAKVYVRKIIRPKYVVPGSQGEGCVAIAEMPSLPIPRSNAGAGLLAHLCTSKFVDHLPFYRQAQIFKREKIPLAEATLKGWYAATCRLPEPLYETLKAGILKADYLQVDETPMPVLTADKPGSTHKGYMWVFHAPVEGLACFYYSKSRAGETASRFLGDYRGALQTDAYAGYNQYKEKEGILLLGCAAHCRRRFEHAKENAPTQSHQALAFFRKLYQVEANARKEGLDYEQRKERREKESASVLAELRQWLEEQREVVLPRSAIGEAVAYTLNIWDRIERYLLEGRFEIDNNLIENQIRPVALGRRNYLFAGSHDGAQYNAMMYSFFACCKRAEVNPQLWLKDVLERIPSFHTSKLPELLPAYWKMSYKEVETE
jgi:transposase